MTVTAPTALPVPLPAWLPPCCCALSPRCQCSPHTLLLLLPREVTLDELRAAVAEAVWSDWRAGPLAEAPLDLSKQPLDGASSNQAALKNKSSKTVRNNRSRSAGIPDASAILAGDISSYAVNADVTISKPSARFSLCRSRGSSFNTGTNNACDYSAMRLTFWSSAKQLNLSSRVTSAAALFPTAAALVTTIAQSRSQPFTQSRSRNYSLSLSQFAFTQQQQQQFQEQQQQWQGRSGANGRNCESNKEEEDGISISSADNTKTCSRENENSENSDYLRLPTQHALQAFVSLVAVKPLASLKQLTVSAAAAVNAAKFASAAAATAITSANSNATAIAGTAGSTTAAAAAAVKAVKAAVKASDKAKAEVMAEAEGPLWEIALINACGPRYKTNSVHSQTQLQSRSAVLFRCHPLLLARLRVTAATALSASPDANSIFGHELSALSVVHATVFASLLEALSTNDGNNIGIREGCNASSDGSSSYSSRHDCDSNEEDENSTVLSPRNTNKQSQLVHIHEQQNEWRNTNSSSNLTSMSVISENGAGQLLKSPRSLYRNVTGTSKQNNSSGYCNEYTTNAGNCNDHNNGKNFARNVLKKNRSSLKMHVGTDSSDAGLSTWLDKWSSSSEQLLEQVKYHSLLTSHNTGLTTCASDKIKSSTTASFPLLQLPQLPTQHALANGDGMAQSPAHASSTESKGLSVTAGGLTLSQLRVLPLPVLASLLLRVQLQFEYPRLSSSAKRDVRVTSIAVNNNKAATSGSNRNHNLGSNNNCENSLSASSTYIQACLERSQCDHNNLSTRILHKHQRCRVAAAAAFHASGGGLTSAWKGETPSLALRVTPEPIALATASTRLATAHVDCNDEHSHCQSHSHYSYLANDNDVSRFHTCLVSQKCCVCPEYVQSPSSCSQLPSQSQALTRTPLPQHNYHHNIAASCIDSISKSSVDDSMIANYHNDDSDNTSDLQRRQVLSPASELRQRGAIASPRSTLTSAGISPVSAPVSATASAASSNSSVSPVIPQLAPPSALSPSSLQLQQRQLKNKGSIAEFDNADMSKRIAANSKRLGAYVLTSPLSRSVTTAATATGVGPSSSTANKMAAASTADAATAVNNAGCNSISQQLSQTQLGPCCACECSCS